MLEDGGSIAEEAGEFCPERMMDGTREAGFCNSEARAGYPGKRAAAT